MKLDLKKPTLVLAGAWNPTIFQPGWIAKYAFGVPEGEKVLIDQLLEAIEGQTKQTSYIKSIGIGASHRRLEFYANRADAETLDLLEDVTFRILDTLPHTPVSAYGINYFFVVDKPDIELINKLRVADDIEKHFTVLGHSLTTSILINPECTLNLRRTVQKETVTFDLNYHHPLSRPQEIRDMLGGEVAARLAESVTILDTLYGLKTFEAIGHSEPSAEEAAK